MVTDYQFPFTNISAANWIQLQCTEEVIFTKLNLVYLSTLISLICHAISYTYVCRPRAFSWTIKHADITCSSVISDIANQFEGQNKVTKDVFFKTTSDVRKFRHTLFLTLSLSTEEQYIQYLGMTYKHSFDLLKRFFLQSPVLFYLEILLLFWGGGSKQKSKFNIIKLSALNISPHLTM